MEISGIPILHQNSNCQILKYNLSLSGKNVHVWIIGSSFIKRDFVSARSRADGIHLGLQARLQADLLWQGKGGMKWREIISKVKHLLTFINMLVIHCGVNDLQFNTPKMLRCRIIKDLNLLQSMIPHAKIIWSQILPRPIQKEQNRDDLEKLRKRVYSAVAKEVFRHLHGGYIKYPDIRIDHIHLYLKDKVHLSQTGNDIFLNTMSGGIEVLIRGIQTIIPDTFN